MSWTQGPLRWPASAGSLHSRAHGVLSQLPATQDNAVARLQGLAGRAQYRPHPLSEAATALTGLRNELDHLLVTGRCLTVTPYQHGVGQQQGLQFSLAAPNAVATLAAKLQDGADPCCPAGNCMPWPGWSPVTAPTRWPASWLSSAPCCRCRSGAPPCAASLPTVTP